MRAIIFVLDGVGVGNAPDAADYGDYGTATLQHIAQKMEGFTLKNLWQFGLANIVPIEGMSRNTRNIAAFGSMVERSIGKDSTSGHWELGGLVVEKQFPLYPDGFPDEIIQKFEKAIGRKVLFNKAASGTEIIEKLGREHIETGYPIVYTSADSVFQIAAHEEIVPLKMLYDWCKIARGILSGDFAVARVIARPFIGIPPNFSRTPNRHDYSLPPFGKTMLDIASEHGFDVVAIGKIFDLYAGSGITMSLPSIENKDGIETTIDRIKKRFDGILMTNLVDFDMKFGHRRKTLDFAQALKEFDSYVPKIIEAMNDEDILFITADHGNDPTHCGSDHTREKVPILIYGSKVKPVDVGERESFADLGATVCEYLNIAAPKNGTSFANIILT
jgi:phosphopentomutase